MKKTWFAKIALLAAVAMLASFIPVFAGAVPVTPPTYASLVAGDTAVTGQSVQKLTITITFPNGAERSTTAEGGLATWSVPSPVKLSEGDVLTMHFTDGNTTGMRTITVVSAGNPGGTGYPGNVNQTDDGEGTGTSAGNNTGSTPAAAVTDNTTAPVADDTVDESNLPATGDSSATLIRTITFTVAALIVIAGTVLFIKVANPKQQH